VFGIKGHLNELSHLLQQSQEHDDYLPPHSSAVHGRESAPVVEEAHELVDDITRGIYRLEEILSEFRDFVLATQLHTTESDLNQILRSVTAESFPRNSSIDLQLNLAPSLPLVMADE